MNKRSFDELLKDGLTSLADEARIPLDLGDRALDTSTRKVRSRIALAATAVVAVGVITYLVTSSPNSIPPGTDGAASTGKGSLAVAYLVPGQGETAPTAFTYNLKSHGFDRTPYAWAIPDYTRANLVAVIGRSGDPAGLTSDAARRIGILNQATGETRWIELPFPAWAAYWSPDNRKILASLIIQSDRTGVDYGGYVIVDPTTMDKRVVRVAEPARTPFQWASSSEEVVASFADRVVFFNLDGSQVNATPVKGTIPLPLSISPNGQRMLVETGATLQGHRYSIVSVSHGQVIRRFEVGGEVLGWLCSDALLFLRHSSSETQLYSLDLRPFRRLEPAYETYDSNVSTLMLKLDILYASGCGRG